jgi:proteic killer suppression protein
MPAPRLHELTGDRRGQLSVDLVFPRRLILVPAAILVPRTSGRALALARIDHVRILEIADTH